MRKLEYNQVFKGVVQTKRRGGREIHNELRSQTDM